MTLRSQVNKLIVIGGPTASGKTSLAIDLAQLLQTEIISADSRQCYRELNIGVAKPSEQELARVQHYFIDSHSIHEEVSVGEFMRYALQKLDAIFEKNNTAICVGGTGLYIKALCEGVNEMPTIDKKIKASVENEYDKHGLAWLQNELQDKDPAFIQQADANNPMRLLRALVFFESHNKSILEFQQGDKPKRNFDVINYSIDMPREKLYNRINLRVDTMMEEGLLEEVEKLLDFKDMKALQTVGYKELFQHMSGDWTFQHAVDKIKQHTRNYAKRQITWFKNQGHFDQMRSDQILSAVKSTFGR